MVVAVLASLTTPTYYICLILFQSFCWTFFVFFFSFWCYMHQHVFVSTIVKAVPR